MVWVTMRTLASSATAPSISSAVGSDTSADLPWGKKREKNERKAWKVKKKEDTGEEYDSKRG